MPEQAPEGVMPLFLREKTLAKFGIPGDVENFKISKAAVMKDIQENGALSDFEPAKKLIEAYPLEDIFIRVDKTRIYGQEFLLYVTAAALDLYNQEIQAKEDARLEQIRLEEEAEAARLAAEFARLNVVYEDKPVSPRGWAGSVETESEIKQLVLVPTRDRIMVDVYRPKRNMNRKDNAKFFHQKCDKAIEFKPDKKDTAFKAILESDMGIQAAPMLSDSHGQTTWFQSINQIVQYEAAQDAEDVIEAEAEQDNLIRFLELATTRVELALQQNESVDIFHETFRTQHDEILDGSIAENELKETKNFADPNYSKSKALVAIDWVPKRHDMVAVSGVRNINFDARSAVSGQSNISYILLWEFRQLVRPVILMESHSEVFTFKFNPVNPGFVAGGCMSGQVVLWDIGDRLEVNKRRGSTRNKIYREQSSVEESDDLHGVPRHPIYVSNVDYSHNKAVADLFWLPPNTQFNYRGHLVSPEHLDGKCYQFVTVAGDGQVMVWDIRYETIAADNLKHISNSKYVPMEKASAKEGGASKPLWAPVFKVHLKRFEGVGEYSLCRACCSGTLKSSVSSKSSLAGDCRTHVITTTEEGDILFVDLNIQKVAQGGGGKATEAKDDEEDDRGETSNDFVRWSELDQSRPSVGLQQSPFFADIILTVGDWNFHIWKVGHSRPLFVSPLSESYLTAGCWSPTRPAVLLVACADGHIMAWDFTDTSYKPSIPLKATQARITSMNYLLDEGKNRQQLLAAGDETGTLHIFEIPRVLHRPLQSLQNEELIMEKFLERELQRQLNREFGSGGSDLGHNHHLSNNNLQQFGVDSQESVVNLVAEATARDDMKRMASAAQKKEEDEFLKMEQTFISELGLASGDLPPWLSAPVPPQATAK